MSQSAYITLVQGSAVDQITLEDIKSRLTHYREQTALTGRQLGWDYANAAFPYTMESKPDEEERWFYLKGNHPLYKYIVIGYGRLDEAASETSAIQVVLPEGSTHGDKSKANELCKWLGKQLLAEVRLFNGRTIYYNPRK
ncbi:DUF1885 family protein [Cohnella nanjingensis]|uniref:DUF1885 family protein n=1 Tax=Cohnella nanjingensis TaxID=1387779 RepID=A0A7X0RPI9_9BACL|nr:DUF1885 family protein [Cohnella nanjingensis]MBB6671098.1 DUF1885 family protein [Cohnella nanjingensis]